MIFPVNILVFLSLICLDERNGIKIEREDYIDKAL